MGFLKKNDAVTAEHHEKNESALVTEDGGFTDRPRLEKRLLRKIDARFSILIIIYILNCESCARWPCLAGLVEVMSVWRMES